MRLNLAAVLLLRCPRCATGNVFRRLVIPNASCPACGLHFEREPGYFTGAIYASYTIGIVTSLPVWIVLLVFGVNPFLIVAVAALQLLISAPFMFIYSRVIWLHLDNLFNPFSPVARRPDRP